VLERRGCRNTAGTKRLKAASRSAGLGPHIHHQHLTADQLPSLPPGLDLDINVFDHYVSVTEPRCEYPGNAQRRTPFFVLNLRQSKT
jgi:hypothetical protein